METFYLRLVVDGSSLLSSLTTLAFVTNNKVHVGASSNQNTVKQSTNWQKEPKKTNYYCYYDNGSDILVVVLLPQKCPNIILTETCFDH